MNKIAYVLGEYRLRLVVEMNWGGVTESTSLAIFIV